MLHQDEHKYLAQVSLESLTQYLEPFSPEYKEAFKGPYRNKGGDLYNIRALINYIIRQYNEAMSSDRYQFDLRIARLTPTSYDNLCQHLIPYFEDQFQVYLQPCEIGDLQGLSIFPVKQTHSNVIDQFKVIVPAAEPVLKVDS